jgi:putative pyruvate formate lyase activating enzyme
VRALFHEEPCISGKAGSGAIFLTGCTQVCAFCQNFDFNIERQGRVVSVEELTRWFLELQKAGCHNIHWISPTHQLPWLVEALNGARDRGLVLPVIYNTGGYERAQILRLLEGKVDVYLPDFKFWDEETAVRLLRVPGYPEAARSAIIEMKKQVGDLTLDSHGIASRGLLVRHLVMPGYLEDAKRIFNWLAEEVGPETHVNVMPVYQPLYRAHRHEQINRQVLPEEWHQAMDLARAAGLRNLIGYSVPVTPTSVDLLRRLGRTD